MEVVEGQDAVVDCQEAEEPGGTDKEKQQKAATKAPAAGYGRTQGTHKRHAGLVCGAHRGHGRTGNHTGTQQSQEDTMGDYGRSLKESGGYSGSHERTWGKHVGGRGAVRGMWETAGTQGVGGKVNHPGHRRLFGDSRAAAHAGAPERDHRPGQVGLDPHTQHLEPSLPRRGLPF